MKFLGNGSVEALLLKGAKSKNRKSKLLIGLQKMVTGLQKEENTLQDVRIEMQSMMADLQAEDKLIEQELASISVVRGNIENLLGIDKEE